MSDEVAGLLRQLGIGAPPIPVERIARQFGAHIIYEPFEGELSGLLFRDASRTIVGVNAPHPMRQRFTIGCEKLQLVFSSCQVSEGGVSAQG